MVGNFALLGEMSSLLVLFLLVGTVCCREIRVCNIQCEPKDEFEIEDETTADWDVFMDMLLMLTSTVYSLGCYNSEDMVQIDGNSDFIWSLRWKIYDERQNISEKTLNDCYCDFNDDAAACKSVEFRECMASARQAMFVDMMLTWGNEIRETLEKLASQC